MQTFIVNCKVSIFLCAVFLLLTPQTANANEKLSAAIDKRIEVLQTRFNIPVRYKGADGDDSLNYEFLPSEEYIDLYRYLLLFEEEIRKYPPGFFKTKNIQSIGLVWRLFKGETPAEGLYIPSRRMMLFDVKRSFDNKALQKHGIHHEIFHMMALQSPQVSSLKDSTWSKLNSHDFVYGKQSSIRKGNPINRFAPSLIGFVTDYSMASPKEDQAEIFACLMQANHLRLVNKWQINDHYLRQKVRTIKDFVAAYDPEMNEDYWEKIREE